MIIIVITNINNTSCLEENYQFSETQKRRHVDHLCKAGIPLLHPDGRISNSDLFVNSFIIVFCENFLLVQSEFRTTKISLLTSIKKTFYEPVRSGYSSIRVFHTRPFVNINHGFSFTHCKHIAGKLGFCKYLMTSPVSDLCPQRNF